MTGPALREHDSLAFVRLHLDLPRNEPELQVVRDLL